ncbi:MAG: hypothetical protein LBL13_10255 [Bacteroidales bacterium]|jgi:hypothetical protein|nr:hypothetical protein [Bacteroidales bacterium]
MIYIIGVMSVWILVSILVKTLLFSEQEKQEPVDGLMGIAHDVFQLEKEKTVEDNISDSLGNDLSEDNFEVEYDSIEIDDKAMVDDDNIDNNTQEGSIVGFEEIQQMVTVVDNDKPLSDFDNKNLEDVKQTIKQIKDTDFFEKMIKTKDEISRRIDDILNNINQ